MNLDEKFEQIVKEDYEKGVHKKSDKPKGLRTMITIGHIVQRMDEINIFKLSEKDLKSLIALAELTDFVIDNINREKQKEEEKYE